MSRDDLQIHLCSRGEKKEKKKWKMGWRLFGGVHSDISRLWGTGAWSCNAISGLHNFCVSFFCSFSRGLFNFPFLRGVGKRDFGDVVDWKDLHWIQHELIYACAIFIAFFTVVVRVVSWIRSEIPTWKWKKKLKRIELWLLKKGRTVLRRHLLSR